MHTRIEKTAPLFADEFEKKELEKRADYFAGKSQVDEAELNKRMDEFSGLMTPGEAIKYMLKLGVPTELSDEDKNSSKRSNVSVQMKWSFLRKNSGSGAKRELLRKQRGNEKRLRL